MMHNTLSDSGKPPLAKDARNNIEFLGRLAHAHAGIKEKENACFTIYKAN